MKIVQIDAEIRDSESFGELRRAWPEIVFHDEISNANWGRLYEERPEAFVRGAVRVRLGQLGARLPPAAAQAADRAHLAPFLWRFHLAPSLRGDLRGWPELLRSTGLAARQTGQPQQVSAAERVTERENG